MNRITVAGNLIVDFVKSISSYPEQGTLASITGLSRGVGGCAANTAVDLALMDDDLRVRSIGRVGDDDNGRYIVDTLTRAGVLCDAITDRRRATSFTDVMNNQDGGERTFFHYRGANAFFCPEDIDIAALDCDLFHIGYILLLDDFDREDPEYGTRMARTLAAVKSRGIKTSFDVVSEHGDRFGRIVTPSLKYCDYLIINELESSSVTGIAARDDHGQIIDNNIWLICNKLLSMGVGELVAIHAPEAGWALRKNGEFTRVQSADLPADLIKGKVGAGDAFCAGMLYAICKGYDLRYSLRYAAAAAACNLTEANSIDGMRDRSGIVAMMDQWVK